MTLDLGRDLKETFGSKVAGLDRICRLVKNIRDHAKRAAFYGPSIIVGECLHQDDRNPHRYDGVTAPEHMLVPLVECGSVEIDREKGTAHFVMRGPFHDDRLSPDSRTAAGLRVTCSCGSWPEDYGLKVEYLTLKEGENDHPAVVLGTRAVMTSALDEVSRSPGGTAAVVTRHIDLWASHVARAVLSEGVRMVPRRAGAPHP